MSTRSALRCAALSLALLVCSVAPADQAKARKKLDDEYIPFTTEKFLSYVFMGDRKMIALFLEAGMPVDSMNDRGTALHRAAEGDDPKLVEMLLKAGANPNARAKNGDTPLCRAADRGGPKIVDMLLAAHADPTIACSYGRTALHEAAEENSVPMVTALLKAGAQVEARDEHSETPLAFALKAQTPEALKALIAAGADVNAKWSHGTMPLHEAVDHRNLEGIKVLLAAGAAVDGRDGNGQTPLWRCANLDYVEAIPVLLAAGADPEAKDSSRESVRKIAERARSVRAIELLKDAKKVDVAPVAARTAPKSEPKPVGDPKAELKRMGFKMDAETFFKRVEADDGRAISLFLAAGFDPATKNEQGRPALYVAVEVGKHDAALALLDGGANPNDVGKASNPQFEYGETLLMKAVDRGDADLVRAILAKKVDPNKANKYGMTALVNAVNLNRADLVEMLLKAGAKVGKLRESLKPLAKDPQVKKLIKEAA